MKKILEVENVKCGGCAATLTKELLTDFGLVSVNLELQPRQITIDIDENQMEALKLKLRDLGYPLSSDQLTTMQNVGTKAKSYVSCAIGKMANSNK